MVRMLPLSLSLLIAGIAVPVAAQDLRPYCANRPSLGASACVTDVGHAMVELGILDWQRERDADGRTDTTLAGDLLVRYGIGPTTEVHVGWTIAGRVDARDAVTRRTDRSTRIGVMMVAVQQNLVGPDGSGFSIAVQPFVTAPTGRTPIGAGTWGGGVVIPVGYDLTDTVQLQFTGEVDAAPDSDTNGRHLAMSGIFGLAVQPAERFSATAEILIGRDRDPEDAMTTLLAALSGGYMVRDDFQIDGGAAFGLNSASPDARIFVGMSHRF